MNSSANGSRSTIWGFLVLWTGAVACLVWSHWTELAEMTQRWSHDPQYSHGYLVPIFTLALLWLRRDFLIQGLLRPVWWGALLLGFGITLHLAGAYFYYNWMEAVSLLPCLLGATVLVGGWAAWRWSWPAIGFLIFMIPLPYFLEIALAGPLQRLAVISSTFLLQTFGLPALAEGNVILLSEVELGIVEACNGLRMLMAFFALAGAVVLVSRRVWWEKILVIASAVPIALTVNVIRITATGVLYEKVSNEAANAVFHDFAGWLMMPVALFMLWLELGFLKRLFSAPQLIGPIGLDLGAMLGQVDKGPRKYAIQSTATE